MRPVFAALRRFQLEPTEDAFRALGAPLRAESLDDACRFAQGGLRLPVHRERDDLIRRCRGDAKCALLRVLQPVPERERILQSGKIALQCRDVPAELIRRCETGKRVECGTHPRCARVRQHVLARLGQCILGVDVIDNAKMRRQRRFEREAPQQRLAEGVDRADAHAAGQVEHAGEQRACIGQGLFRRHNAQRLQFPRQCRVVQRDPLAQDLL